MSDQRITLRTIRKWVREGEPFSMLTAYDATTASWLWRGGVKCLLVGDTAGQVILGHDATIHAPLDFMVEITAAVRRGAPDAFIMADMPFGSYQCGDDQAVANAMRFLTEGKADVVKMEVNDDYAPLVKRLTSAGVPVVAHTGSLPQHMRVKGGYGSVGRDKAEAAKVVETAKLMIESGCVMLLLEAVPNEVAETISALATSNQIPLIGCGAGSACHGHVVVLQDLLGMTDWQPPFAPPVVDLGKQIQEAAARWDETVRSGRYLKEDHPYRMRDDG
jgi:3-methyl-2-oxobutanoate hydroxymethyltransferase